MVTPNQRVEHYMSKLRDYLLVDEEQKRIYNDAARRIQRHVRLFLWRKALHSVKDRISTLGLPPSTSISEPLSLEHRASILKPRQSWARKRSSVAMIPMYARAYRGSVLQFARQVSGTGLREEAEPRQSMRHKQLESQIFEVAPVLQHMMSTLPAQRTGSYISTCLDNVVPKPSTSAAENSSQVTHEDLDSLHEKMDQIVDSLGLLAREIGETKNAMMFSSSSAFSRL